MSGDELFVCQPVFDEGDDWPESYGTPHLIEAPTREAAEVAFPDVYTGLAGAAARPQGNLRTEGRFE